MRINVYGEEMGESVEVITTVSRNGESFIGLRVWLKSPQEILDHSTPEDDDRNAVTFWFPGYAGLFDFVEEIKRARRVYALSHDGRSDG